MEYNNNSEYKNLKRNNLSNIQHSEKVNSFYNHYHFNNGLSCEYDNHNTLSNSESSDNYDSNDNDSDYDYDLNFNKLIKLNKLRSLISDFESKIIFLKKLNDKTNCDEEKLNSIDSLIDNFTNDFEFLLNKLNKNIISNGQIKINNRIEFEF